MLDLLRAKKAGGAAPYTLLHTALGWAGATSVATFSAVPLGAEKAARRIIVSVSWSQNASNPRTLSTLTVGGVSMTRRSRAIGTSDAVNAEVWDGIVASGTTGDIVATFNGVNCNIAIAVYSTQCDYVDNRAYAASGTTSSVSIPVPAHGFVICAFALYYLVDATVLTGVDEKRRDEVSPSPAVPKLHILGDKFFRSAATVTITGDGTSDNWRYLCAVSYS